jgi:arylformamidase
MVELTAEYCDRHYNFMSPAMIGQLLDQLERRSADTRAALNCELNLRYGSAENECFDLFRPSASGGALLVFIHGGYWAFADKSQFSYPAPGFLQAGIGFATINYALVPHVRIEEQIEQCRRAVAYLYRNARVLGFDPEKLYVSGHSAGGHLASMVMLTDWPRWDKGLPAAVVKAGLTISGLHDLEAIRRTATLNAVLQLDPERAAALSPIRHAPRLEVPLYTAVGGRENEEFQRQTSVLNEQWRRVLKHSLVMPADDHFSVLDRFGDGRSELFEMTLRMMAMTADAH